MGKIFFEVEGLSGLMEQPELTTVDLIAEGVDVYLDGIMRHQVGLEDGGASLSMVRSGEQIMRIGGELIGRVFDISPHAAARVVDKAVERVYPSYLTHELRSFVAARMVEGFVEAGRKDLATDLFELRVKEPTVQEQVLQFMMKRDPDITNSLN